MKNKIFQQQWNSDEGNAAIIVICVLFTLICFLALPINVGFHITEKLKMQNAADSAAESGALWIARGLNTLSILNVSMTETLASIIFLKAIDKANERGKVICTSNMIAAAASFNYKWLNRLTKVAVPGLKEVEYLYDNKIKSVIGYPEDEDPETLWGIMRWLKKGEDAINATIDDVPILAIMAENEARTIAKVNQAEYCQWLPKYSGMPVKQGSFHDLCHPTKYGTSGYQNFLGFDSALDMEIANVKVKDIISLLWTVYPNGEGADTAPLCPLVASVYPDSVRVAYNTLCESGETTEYENITTQCSKCERNATWVGTRVLVEPCDIYGSEIGNRISIGEKIGNIYPVDYDIKIEKQDQCKVYQFHNKTNGYSDEGDEDQSACYKDEWTLVKCDYTEVEYVESDDDKPVPLVLDDEWRKKVNFIALVKKQTKDLWHIFQKSNGKNYSFGDSEVKQTYGIAQVEIYNPTDENLFNQDWHVKLVPFDPDPDVIDMYKNMKDSSLISLLKGLEELSDLITH